MMPWRLARWCALLLSGASALQQRPATRLAAAPAATRMAAAPDAGAAAPRVLVPVAAGSDAIEVVTVVDVLRRAGADVTVAALGDDLACACARGVTVVADRRVADVTGRGAAPWDAIALTGGEAAAEAVRDSVRLHPVLERHFRGLRPLAGIGVAPAVILEPKGFLEGYAATAAPDVADDLGGSLAEDARARGARVVRDRHVITARGAGCALEAALCVVDALLGADAARAAADAVGPPPPNAAPRRPDEWRLPPPPAAANDDWPGEGSAVDRALAKLTPPKEALYGMMS